MKRNLALAALAFAATAALAQPASASTDPASDPTHYLPYRNQPIAAWVSTHDGCECVYIRLPQGARIKALTPDVYGDVVTLDLAEDID